MPKPPLQNTLTHFLDTRPGSELEEARLLPLDLVDPNPAQSRQVFDETSLEELAASIREHGVLQPIIVQPHPTQEGRYQAVVGERRIRAARRASLTAIPALVRELTEAEAAYITAIENLQREDLDLEDEARQYQALLTATGLSQRALAEQLGVSHNYIAERVRLLARPDLLTAYRTGALTLRGVIQAERTPPAPASVIPDYTPTASPQNDGVVIPDYKPIPSSQIAPAPPPMPVERAALDQVDGSGDSRRIPYRARALDAAATTLLRLDWATVPPTERATVRAQIGLLLQALAAAEVVLQEG